MTEAEQSELPKFQFSGRVHVELVSQFVNSQLTETYCACHVRTDTTQMTSNVPSGQLSLYHDALPEVVAALEAVEWQSGERFDTYCPSCREISHTADCQLASALAAGKAAIGDGE